MDFNPYEAPRVIQHPVEALADRLCVQFDLDSSEFPIQWTFRAPYPGGAFGEQSNLLAIGLFQLGLLAACGAVFALAPVLVVLTLPLGIGLRFWSHRLWRQALSSDLIRGRVLTINPQGLELRLPEASKVPYFLRELGPCQVRWRAVQRIEVKRGILRMTDALGRQLTVPERAFEHLEQWDAFCRAAKLWHGLAGPPWYLRLTR